MFRSFLLSLLLVASQASEPFIGEIKMFAGNFAPRGYAMCDGQLLPIDQNSALFALLGTVYGGDGRNTFALPDLRGRAPMHAGTGPGLTSRPLGQKSGQERVTLSLTEIPSHSHTTVLKGTDEESDTDNPSNAVPAVSRCSDGYSASPSSTVNMAPAAVEVGATGGGQSHNNMQPYLAINYIIALQGTFPSRP